MTVSTIFIDSEGQIFTEGRHRAILVDKKVYATLHDPALFTGLSQRQLMEAADKNALVLAPKFKKKVRVSWPGLQEVRREFPRARVIRAETRSPMPRATTVYWKTPAGRKNETLYRSMKSVRDDLGLTDSEFEAIANRAPGYEAMMLPTMTAIVVEPEGYRHPADKVFHGRDQGVLFEMTEDKQGIHINYIGPKTVKRHVEIPRPVLVNSEWKKEK